MLDGLGLSSLQYLFQLSLFDKSIKEGERENEQRFKYNGKELDRALQLNTYDYAARYMDPAIGRFTSIDPLAEKYYSWSPYAYVANNPLKYIDPDGRMLTDYYTLKQGNYKHVGSRSDGRSDVMVHIQDAVVVEANAITNTTPNNVIDVVSTLITIGDRTTNSVVSNGDNIRIGSNSKVYLPTQSGGTFKGNQYVNTKTVSSVTKGVSKVAGPASVAIGAIKIGDGIQKDGGTFGDNAKKASVEVAGSTIGGIAGAKGGAALGATIGTFIAGSPGTAVGGIIGGISGGIGGAMAGEKAAAETYETIKEENKKKQ